MRKIVAGVCCVLAACGDPSPNRDASVDGDGATIATMDGSSGLDASLDRDSSSDAPTRDASSLADSTAESATDLDADATDASIDARTIDAAPDSASSDASIDASAGDAALDSPANDARSDADSAAASDARIDAATSDAPAPDVSSMPDVASDADASMGSDASPGTVDFTARGYFQRTRPPPFVSGVPAGYLPRPSGLTYAQLAQLQQDCVDRINQYRDGTLRFTGGAADPGVPRAALQHLQGNNTCSSAQALGDLIVNAGASACAGAGTNAFSCPSSGATAHNSCCARTGSTYTQIRTQLFTCLQQMWDEGTGLPDNAAFTSANGHWFNMRNSVFTQLSCGFAFDDRGRVWMAQDFAASRPATVAQTCACTTVGASDGCGGVCVAGP